MSIIPSSFFGGRYEPFHVEVYPFVDLDFGSSLIHTSSHHMVAPPPAFPHETASFANFRVDWTETPEGLVFRANVPGLKKEEVKVEIENGAVLCISGGRSVKREERSGAWRRVEQSSGNFFRRFTLPPNAKVHAMKKSMENGVLTVVIPYK